MAGFEKNCPVCGKKYTNLLEYTVHIGKSHQNIHPGKIFEIGQEKREHLRE